MLRKTIHQNWQVELGDGGSLNALTGKTGVKKTVTLPHDMSIETERNPEEPNGAGNGYFVEDNYVYTTSVPVDAEDAGKRVWLEFEGVHQNASVYVNGSYVGKRAYGYSNFYLDITPFTHFGEENAIKVVVKNGVPGGRWYTGGGIYRDVHLMVCDTLHFIPDGIHLTTVECDGEQAVILAECSISHEGYSVRKCRIKVTLYDKEGNAAQGDMPVTVKENEQGTYALRLYVENPKLWDAENPDIYRYEAVITEEEKETDREEGSFGIRTLSLNPKHGLRVNGKTVKLRGGCIHHDYGILGAAEFPHAAYERVKKLKDAGFNAVRSSHYPLSKKMLAACDELGMYVMDEFSDVWTSSKVAFDYSIHLPEWWEEDIKNMVNKDYNHPSVIMYSIGNEIPETGNAMDAGWGKKFADKIRSMDNSRYVTNSINLLLSGMELLKKMRPAGSGEQGGGSAEINSAMSNMAAMMNRIMENPMLAKLTEEAADQVDIVGYNYATARIEKEGEEYPNRIHVGSETYPGDLDANWELVEKEPHVIGDFDWTAWDYLGETGIGGFAYGEDAAPPMYAPYPYKAAYCGDINLIGDRRPVSYWREIIWGFRKDPYMAVRPPEHYGQERRMTPWGFSDAVRNWTWKGFEGKPATVEVYVAADEVALFLDGKEIAKKAVGEKKKAFVDFDVTYTAGTLEAVAYKDGKETGRDQIRTAEKAKLSVRADAEEIPADGSDIAYVDVMLCDENGNLDASSADEVTVEIEGPGVIAGFGSADPKSEENYFDTKAKLYEGRVRAAIRGTGEGTVTITFTKGEERESVTLKAVH